MLLQYVLYWAKYRFALFICCKLNNFVNGKCDKLWYAIGFSSIMRSLLSTGL